MTLANTVLLDASRDGNQIHNSTLEPSSRLRQSRVVISTRLQHRRVPIDRARHPACRSSNQLTNDGVPVIVQGRRRIDLINETGVRRRVLRHPRSGIFDALELSIGQEIEKESRFVCVFGGEVKGVRKMVILGEFQELVFEVAVLEGGFQLVSVAIGCRG